MSPPMVLLSVATLSPIAARASGTCAMSGPSWERISLYDSTAWAADPPKVLARSLALRSISLSPSPVTPVSADRSVMLVFRSSPARVSASSPERAFCTPSVNWLNLRNIWVVSSRMPENLAKAPCISPTTLVIFSPFTTALPPKFIVNVTVLLGIFIKFASVNSSNHGRSHNIHYRHHIMAL